jgi:hypothetical protein
MSGDPLRVAQDVKLHALASGITVRLCNSCRATNPLRTIRKGFRVIAFSYGEINLLGLLMKYLNEFV